MDVTVTSPFAGKGCNSFVPGRAVDSAVERKHKKYATKCADHGHVFRAFAMSVFGEFSAEALDILKRVVRFTKGTTHCNKNALYLYSRISFSLQKGVGGQLVARLPTSFL